jgi:predicted ABC-type ATPase
LPKIYLIAGCNGAGKTTASFTMLPEMLNCKEFVNADNIALGLSPFQPENVSFEAGRMMLNRIEQLVRSKVDFAIETTLSSRNYLIRVRDWQKKGYEIILVYFWLNNPLLAIERIKDRVLKGGHSVPDEIVFRRYYKGIKNLFTYFIRICDYWLIVDNSAENPIMIAEGINEIELEIFNNQIWTQLKDIYNGK